MLPEGINIDCFICDDMRMEKSGKTILIGCYQNSVLVNPVDKDSGEKFVLPKLVFACMVQGVSGIRTVEWRVEKPSSALVGVKKARQIHVAFGVRPSIGHGIQITVNPFEIDEFGLYRLILDFGDFVYEKRFVVSTLEQYERDYGPAEHEPT